MIIMIAAIDQNLGLGKDGELLIKNKEDMKHFKQTTLNHKVVMGRKTYESIGKPLPNRTNIILSRDVNYKVDGCIVINDIQSILDMSENEDIFIIGGGEIYTLFLDYSKKIILSEFDDILEADTIFPSFTYNKSNIIYDKDFKIIEYYR